jgi:hypothetical protein
VKVDLGVWDWLGRFIVVLLVAAALVGLVVWYLPLINLHESRQNELYQKRQDILHERERIRRLTEEIQAFNRPETIERLARELADHARTNELLFEFIDE